MRHWRAAGSRGQPAGGGSASCSNPRHCVPRRARRPPGMCATPQSASPRRCCRGCCGLARACCARRPGSSCRRRTTRVSGGFGAARPSRQRRLAAPAFHGCCQGAAALRPHSCLPRPAPPTRRPAGGALVPDRGQPGPALLLPVAGGPGGPLQVLVSPTGWKDVRRCAEAGGRNRPAAGCRNGMPTRGQGRQTWLTCTPHPAPHAPPTPALPGPSPSRPSSSAACATTGGMPRRAGAARALGGWRRAGRCAVVCATCAAALAPPACGNTPPAPPNCWHPCRPRPPACKADGPPAVEPLRQRAHPARGVQP